MRRSHRRQARRSWSQALLIAAPLMSAPLLAAVALALGTFCVSVPVTRTRSTGMPRPSAATWAILVFRPWPISVPPWFTLTVPSW
jgi:hypothetical protein